MGNTLKKLSLGLTLLFSSLAFGDGAADGISNQVIGPFGTLNNYDSSIVIPNDRAQDVLNVDITPGGRSVKKRSGYSTAYTLTITTAPTHGVFRFYDSSGNEVFLFFNDHYMSSSVNGNTPAVLMSSGTNAATYQCVDYAGQAYCAGTGRANLIKTDGATWNALAGLVSTGTMVAITPDRLVESGFQEAPNRIDFSASALFTSWAQPFLLPTDPNSITIASPGSKITHITYAFQRLMWFKDSSFGYILFDNSSLSNWQVRTVSSNIGTLDNSSIYWQDVLFFRGQDGHFYSYDGSTVQRMSRDIGGSIAQSQTRRTNSWTQTTAADFNAGSYSPSLFIDTVTQSGTIGLTFPDNFNTYQNGASSSRNIWNTVLDSGGGTGSVSANGTLNLTENSNGYPNPFILSQTTSILPDFQVGTTYHFLLQSLPPANAPYFDSQFNFALSTRTLVSSDAALVTPRDWYYNIKSTQSGVGYINDAGNGFNSVPSLFSSTSFTIPATIDFFVSTTTFSLSINGVLNKSGTHTWPHGGVYFRFMYQTDDSLSHTMSVDNFSVVPETATFQSQVENASNISVWDSFLSNRSDNGGSNTFYIRSATYSFAVSSLTPSWTAISPGNIPSISTGSYFQVRDDLSAVTSSGAPQMFDFTQNWFEGTAGDKAYGQYFDYALWWNVQLGGGSTYNNYVLKYDLINNGWLIYDIPMDGMFVRNNSLYFGSSVGGYVYKYGSANNDNGSAINAYWKSKDFFGDSPFTEKAIAEVSASATNNPNSTLTLTTTVDSRYTLSDTWPLYNPNSNFIKYNNCQPLTAIGTTFNFKFGNNAADQPFEVYSGMIGFRPKPIKDTKQ